MKFECTRLPEQTSYTQFENVRLSGFTEMHINTIYWH